MTDIAALSHFAQVAAAAFVPVIANIAPASFGIEQFADLALVKDLNQLFNQPEFSRWQKFRKSDDARFMGFTLPRFLLRESYSLAHSQGTAFPFQESIHSLGDRLWGNASFAFAATLIHAFVDYGWFTDIQGLGDGFTRGGLLTHLPKAYFTVDKTRLTPKITTEFFITDTLERSLSDQGFIAFCQTHYSHYPVFYNARSAQALGAMNTSAAALNGKLVTLLPYLFCACRFAHYIKVIGRDKIGTFLTTAECERYLTNWLSAYVAGNQALANPQRAKYPLRGAKVEVKQRRGMPGSYHCVIHLQPRMQLEQVDTVFILVTELTQRLNHG
jgi:type VI secretion system protein ImpD